MKSRFGFKAVEFGFGLGFQRVGMDSDSDGFGFEQPRFGFGCQDSHITDQLGT